ncbi:hypothetical protein HDU67_004456 [Dinochytrium kinnereticum]|nr:hypothetical protein HDU67_004456 [Dinochytrium kinnereticum]
MPGTLIHTPLSSTTSLKTHPSDLVNRIPVYHLTLRHDITHFDILPDTHPFSIGLCYVIGQLGAIKVVESRSQQEAYQRLIGKARSRMKNRRRIVLRGPKRQDSAGEQLQAPSRPEPYQRTPSHPTNSSDRRVHPTPTQTPPPHDASSYNESIREEEPERSGRTPSHENIELSNTSEPHGRKRTNALLEMVAGVDDDALFAAVVGAAISRACN